jgi:hypothetical protein
MGKPTIYIIPPDTPLVVTNPEGHGVHNGCVLMVANMPFMVVPHTHMAEHFARQLSRVREGSVREGHQLLIDMFGMFDEDDRTHLIMELKGDPSYNTGSIN